MNSNNKKIKFFYHYNKPQTQRNGYPTISIHFNNACHFVKGISVEVPTLSKINNGQPRFVMVGSANKIKIKKSIAYIT